MVQLARHGFVGAPDVVPLAREFRESHVFRLPDLLHSSLLGYLSSQLDSCAWTTRDDGKIAREALPENFGSTSALNFAANTPAFLALIREVTGCVEICGFKGRIYRMAPAADHFDSWHSDVGATTPDRLVGMSINLGRHPYEGGCFRLRDASAGTVLLELPNQRYGSAIFFRISPALEHMVTPVLGSEPKTAFAGWFYGNRTGYYDEIRRTIPDAAR